MSRLSIGRCRYWYGIWHGMCLEGQEAVEKQQKGREESEQDPSAASPAAATADLHGGDHLFMRPERARVEFDG